jgi:hypothetical protein
MWDGNTTVPSHHAGEPAKRPVNGSGSAHPTIVITFAARPMWSGCGSGARLTQAIGAARPASLKSPPMRYKNPYPHNTLPHKRLQGL